MPKNATQYIDQGIALAVGYAPKLLLAILTLLVGLWLIGKICKLATRAAEKREVDATLTPFLVNLLRWGLRVLLLISVASMVGIQTTSFVAVLGAAGLAVGLALQGSLANFAGGVLILIFRPFRVGDFIEAQGKAGVVKEIQIFTTTLINPQNRRVTIPNGPLSNGTITNFTIEGKARMDLVIGISYSADIDKAKTILSDILKNDERVLAEPAPVVEVLELADSSVNLAVRPYVSVGDYWGLHFTLLPLIKKSLDEAGIEIPFPQQDVHLYKQSA